MPAKRRFPPDDWSAAGPFPNRRKNRRGRHGRSVSSLRRTLGPRCSRRRAATVYGLSPTTLPVADTFVPVETNDQHLTEVLSTLGYPGFTYLRSRAPKKHPNEFLLTALNQTSLEARVAEALPWVVANSAELNSWLLENARKYNLQNRLGFVVSLARRAADKRNASTKAENLKEFEALLDDSRLVKEDYFYRPPHTESETQWLRSNRTEDAAHWNVLSDMKPEHLPYAS
jgi:hypothetical protein